MRKKMVMMMNNHNDNGIINYSALDARENTSNQTLLSGLFGRLRTGGFCVYLCRDFFCKMSTFFSGGYIYVYIRKRLPSHSGSFLCLLHPLPYSIHVSTVVHEDVWYFLVLVVVFSRVWFLVPLFRG